MKDIETRNIEEAMATADHAFTVAKRPLYLDNGNRVPGSVAVVREDTGQSLGVVNESYTPVQPRSFYGLIEHMLNENPNIAIDRALTMRNGAVMGVSLSLGDVEYLPGDPVNRSMVMMTSFDCSYAVIGRSISTRFFCENQLPTSGRVFSFKHTTFVNDRLSLAMRMLSGSIAEIDQFDSLMRRFTKIRVTDDQAMQWFDDLIGQPKAGSKRSETRFDNVRAEFVRLLNEGRGAQLSGVRGTAWGVLNALTEYVNHGRSTKVKPGRTESEVRFEAVNFGSGDKLMQRGVKALRQITMG